MLYISLKYLCYGYVIKIRELGSVSSRAGSSSRLVSHRAEPSRICPARSSHRAEPVKSVRLGVPSRAGPSRLGRLDKSKHPLPVTHIDIKQGHKCKCDRQPRINNYLSRKFLVQKIFFKIDFRFL